MKRRKHLSNVFDESRHNEAGDLSKADEQLYGQIAKVDSNRIIAEPINIDRIAPDPVQPRRVLPGVIRGYWETDMPGWMLMERWMLHIEMITGEKMLPGRGDLSQAILQMLNPFQNDEGEIFSNWEQFPDITHFVEIAGLAADIAQNGLTNPITVSIGDEIYVIETGERRWWAYCLLYHLDDSYHKIPARVVERNVWRQASENTKRQNLNAIGKARQFSILLMDLYETSPSGQVSDNFLAFDEIVKPGVCDRAYYAQVADGNEYRIPRGDAEKLLNAMGEKSPARLREIRSVLRVDDDIWQLADDEDWTLGAILAHVRPDTPPPDPLPIHGEGGDKAAETAGKGRIASEFGRYPDENEENVESWGAAFPPGDYQPSFDDVPGTLSRGIRVNDPPQRVIVNDPDKDVTSEALNAAILRRGEVEGPARRIIDEITRLTNNNKVSIFAVLDERERKDILSALEKGILKMSDLHIQIMEMSKGLELDTDRMQAIKVSVDEMASYFQVP